MVGIEIFYWNSKSINAEAIDEYSTDAPLVEGKAAGLLNVL